MAMTLHKKENHKMMNVMDFISKTKDASSETVVKMSNHNKEYTLLNPNCANNGTFQFDGYGIDFMIDWNDKSKSTLADFRSLVEKHSLDEQSGFYSTDADDGGDIQFEEILFIDNVFILV